MSFWPNADHWSVKIPLDTAKLRLIVTTPSGVLRVGLQLRSAETGALLITPSDDEMCFLVLVSSVPPKNT